MSRIKLAFRRAPLLTGAFAIALGLTLWFGGMTVAKAVYWADPRHQNQEIEDWMTLGYVSRSWKVPREILFDALQDVWLRDPARRPPPLDIIARDSGLPEEEIASLLQSAIDAYRANAPEQK